MATTSFVGRERELGEGRRILREHRLLTLVGTGGVGKTRLAVRLGEEVARSFPAGVWLIDLAPFDAASLGGGEGIGRAVSTALGTAPPVDALLVLDTCEHVLEACAEFTTGLLTLAPDTRIVSTSRQPLGVLGEHVLDVPPLSTPDPSTSSPRAVEGSDAVRLFVDRAGSAVPGFSLTRDTAATVAEICARLGGLPLAIELAATRLRALSLSELLGRLDDQHRLLTVGSRVAHPRQRSLTALDDWSLALCTPPERELWARLSVFTGGFDLTAAESVCTGAGIAAPDVLDLLAGLVEKSVVIRVGDHYALPEPTRQYGAGRLSDDRNYRQRHAEHFAALGRRLTRQLHAEGIPAVHATVRREHDNLAAAAAHLTGQPGHEDDVLGLGTLLYLVPVRPEASGPRLREALRNCPAPTRARANALWAASVRALAAGLEDDTTQECRWIVRGLGDQVTAAYVAECDALRAAASGDLATALDLLADALPAHAGDRFGLRQCARITAVLAWQADDGRALRRVTSWIDRDEPANDACRRPLRSVLAGLERLRDHTTDQAEELFGRALAELRDSGEAWWIAVCFDGLVQSACARRDYTRAARLLGCARTLRHRLGVRGPFVGGGLDPHDTVAADLRRFLGDERFSAAVRSGEELDHAVDCATGAPDPAASAHQPRLTPREHEVAELISDGLTNQAIGEVLGISRRTVETHVEHVMAKLGFTRRARIAAWFTSGHPDVPRPRRRSARGS
ncbi:hypothetical protein A6A25_32405 [Saccharothrix sp. CB00851]|nr:hypothetical protein A6A25_32405 [Saccharothrix sp. CB00851]